MFASFWRRSCADWRCGSDFCCTFPGVVDDSRLYADIAMNWLQYGVYGITNSASGAHAFSPSGISCISCRALRDLRMEQFPRRPADTVLFDLPHVLLIADIARRLFSERAAKSRPHALSPVSISSPITLPRFSPKPLEIFFTVLACDFAVCGLAGLRPETSPLLKPKAGPWFGCGLSIGACILLRPDGGILLAAVGAYLFVLFVSAVLNRTGDTHKARHLLTILRAGVILVISALAPLVPWTLRNLHASTASNPLLHAMPTIPMNL